MGFLSWYKTCKKPVAEVSYRQCFKEETRKKMVRGKEIWLVKGFMDI